MAENSADKFRKAFWAVISEPAYARPLKKAATERQLGEWTRILTKGAVEACESLGWKASAKGHKLELLPEARSEYLGLDIVAFPDGARRWRFPVAAFELENSQKKDRIAYCLWKLLCIQADLRVLFCYRRDPSEASGLVRFFREEVVEAMELRKRVKLRGSTIVVVGSRGEAETFPYGFFKWWQLEDNTFEFRLM